MKYWELFKCNNDLSKRRKKVALKYIKIRKKHELELMKIDNELNEIDALANQRISLSASETNFDKWLQHNKTILKEEYNNEPSEVKEKETFDVWVKRMFKEWVM